MRMVLCYAGMIDFYHVGVFHFSSKLLRFTFSLILIFISIQCDFYRETNTYIISQCHKKIPSMNITLTACN